MFPAAPACLQSCAPSFSEQPRSRFVPYVASFILVAEMGDRCLTNIVAECKVCQSVYVRYKARAPGQGSRVWGPALGMFSS